MSYLENSKNTERTLEDAEKDLINTFEKCFENEGLVKGYINLSLKVTRDEILEHVPESPSEYDYINKNYEKILNRVKRIYENDLNAKKAIGGKVYSDELEKNPHLLTQEIRESLKKNGLLEIAKQCGYDENKIYNLEELDKLNEKVQEIEKKKKAEEKQNIIINIITFLAYAFMIGIIPFLFFYIYFTVVKPIING